MLLALNLSAQFDVPFLYSHACWLFADGAALFPLFGVWEFGGGGKCASELLLSLSTVASLLAARSRAPPVDAVATSRRRLPCLLTVPLLA